MIKKLIIKHLKKKCKKQYLEMLLMFKNVPLLENPFEYVSDENKSEMIKSYDLLRKYDLSVPQSNVIEKFRTELSLS